MMNTFCVLLVGLILCGSTVSARTRHVADGIAPDGKVEVVVRAPDALDRNSDAADAYHYDLVVRARPSGRVLFQSAGRWQHSFFSVGTDGYDLQAYWSADSRWVALAFQGSGQARVIRLFTVQTPDRVREIESPDFVPAVLDALGGGTLKSLDVEPVGWSAHRLKVRVSGTTAEPNPATGMIDFEFSTGLQVQARSRPPKVHLSALKKQPLSTGT